MKTPDQKTIGILYPGEMGSNLGRLLSAAGFNVITTTIDRSARTQSLCHDAGLIPLKSMKNVVEQADVIVSVVSPDAALSLAEEISLLAKGRAENLLYVDANSISPLTVFQISECLNRAGIDLVDASIMGPASQLEKRGTLYLSGTRAQEISSDFGKIMRAKIVGEELGRASGLKMIISGIPKGLSALFLETMLLAREMDLLDEALDGCNEIYPSIMEVMMRMLPTYPQHAARRCEELCEVEKTMLWKGMTPRIMRAVGEVTSDLAGMPWIDRDPQRWTIAAIIEAVHQDGTLHGSPRRGAQDSLPLCQITSE